MSDEKCQVAVYGEGMWTQSYPCRRPVKGRDSNGNEVCGIHLRANKNRIERHRKYDAETKERELARAVAAQAVSVLEKHGVSARYTYDGFVVDDVQSLVDLIRRLDE